MADGAINRDAIKPSKKLRFASELLQVLVRFGQRILYDIARIVGMAEQPVDCVEEPILVAAGQFAERGPIPSQRHPDQYSVIDCHECPPERAGRE